VIRRTLRLAQWKAESLLRPRRNGEMDFDGPTPPAGDRELVHALTATPKDEAFITGNGIAARCRFVLNYDVFRVNKRGRDGWWFCKADYLEYFFARYAPSEPFVLFSHNSDRAIDESFQAELDDDRLVAWFAQNPVFEHPKLRALPIGLSNPYWPHGDQKALKAVQAARLPKTELFDVSFNPETNRAERLRCLTETGLQAASRVPYRDYLRRLASAYFCISPNGNGIDCVRTWEALYLRAIPVVTRSLLTEQHADLPLLVLDDWSEFRSIDFGPELYRRLWRDWDPDEIRLDRYFARIEGAIAGLRGAV